MYISLILHQFSLGKTLQVNAGKEFFSIVKSLEKKIFDKKNNNLIKPNLFIIPILFLIPNRGIETYFPSFLLYQTIWGGFIFSFHHPLHCSYPLHSFYSLSFQTNRAQTWNFNETQSTYGISPLISSVLFFQNLFLWYSFHYKLK